MKRILALTALLSLPALLPAAAQDAGERELSFDMGLGAVHAPEYQGSDKSKAKPWLIMRNLSVGAAGATGERAQGFSLGGSFDYRGARKADDFDALKGLDDIDAAVEAGLKLSYTAGPVTGYATMRKGFGGHHGVTGEFGAKYRIDATERTTLWLGAEADYGDATFNGTYFGVTAAESASSGLAAFDPDGGIHAASVGVQARYRLNDDWAVLAEAKYQKLVGDAADSPIVKDKSQPSVRVGVVRHFSFRF